MSGSMMNNGSQSVSAPTALAIQGRDIRRVKRTDAARSFNNLMASPPTITVGTASAASTLNGSRAQYQYDYAALTGGGTAGAVLNTTGPFRWTGFPAVNSGTTHPNWYYAMAQSGGQVQYPSKITGATTSEPVYAVEFSFYGTAFEFGVKGLAGNNFQIFVDDQPIALATNIVMEGTNSGSHYFVKVDFTTASLRRIRIECGLGCHFAGVVGAAGSSEFMYPDWPTPPRALFLSDSYGEGSWSTHSSGPSSFCAEVGRCLGWDWINSGVGATGILNNGGGAPKVKYRDRVANDVVGLAPDIVVIQASINDRYTAWAITTAYVIGQMVTNSGQAYICITGGTSAGAGGPTGTASDITDNTVHWAWLGYATVEAALQNELTLLISAIRNGLPNAKLFMVGMAGLTATYANCASIDTALKATCATLNVPYASNINLFYTSLSGVTYMGADFHPTDLGYKIMGRSCAAQFQPYIDV